MKQLFITVLLLFAVTAMGQVYTGKPYDTFPNYKIIQSPGETLAVNYPTKSITPDTTYSVAISLTERKYSITRNGSPVVLFRDYEGTLYCDVWNNKEKVVESTKIKLTGLALKVYRSANTGYVIPIVLNLQAIQ